MKLSDLFKPNLPNKRHYHTGTYTFLWDRGRTSCPNLFAGACSSPRGCGWKLRMLSFFQKPPNLALGTGSRARPRVPSQRQDPRAPGAHPDSMPYSGS